MVAINFVILLAWTGCNSCSHLKSFRIAEARLGSNSFWARKIWLAWTFFEQLLSPEELEDGGDKARVHKLLSQKDLVGSDRLAEAALVPHLPLLLSPTQLQQVGQQLALVPLPAPVKQ